MSNRHLIAALLVAFGLSAVVCAIGSARAAGPQRPITVFAAASLKESLDEAAVAYERRTGTPVKVAYAASSALARQIEQGAPADVFMSADLDWMDHLQQRALLDDASRRNLLGNRLVLIAPRDAKGGEIALKPGVDLRPRLGNGRLALALTQSVPAGKYARAAFEKFGVWTQLAPQVAEAENVRAALLLVARGEAPLGVVYASDAIAEPRVRVVGRFPAGSHPPIVYPVARLRASDHRQAAAFVRWLSSPVADAIFRRRGFSILD